MSRPISNNLLTPGDIIVANSNPKNLRDVSILITGFRMAAKQSSDNRDPCGKGTSFFVYFDPWEECSHLAAPAALLRLK